MFFLTKTLKYGDILVVHSARELHACLATVCIILEKEKNAVVLVLSQVVLHRFLVSTPSVIPQSNCYLSAMIS